MKIDLFLKPSLLLTGISIFHLFLPPPPFHPSFPLFSLPLPAKFLKDTPFSRVNQALAVLAQHGSITTELETNQSERPKIKMKCRIWFSWREEKKIIWRKNPQSTGENQKTTLLTYDTQSKNQTWATLVRGERSHHCATHASWVEVPHIIISLLPCHTTSSSSRHCVLSCRAAVCTGVSPLGSLELASPWTPDWSRDLRKSLWSKMAAWCNSSPGYEKTGIAICLSGIRIIWIDRCQSSQGM